VRLIALLAKGQKLLVISGPPYWSAVEEWDLVTRQKLRSWAIPVFSSDGGAAVSPDERWLFVGSLATGYRVFDLTTGGIATTSEFGSRGPAFSADSRLLAIPNPRIGGARIWDVSSGREITTLDGFRQGAHFADFSPDGRRLAVTGGGSEAIRLWDMSSYENLITLETVGSTSGATTAFSRTGDSLGAYFGDRILRLWRAPSWNQIEAADRAAANVGQRSVP
jgi:WD40 repeat protein